MSNYKEYQTPQPLTRGTSQRITMSLSELNQTAQTPFPPNSSNPLSSRSRANSENPMNKSTNDYKKELMQLLDKSRGTAYERSLKRFVESKLKEINRDQEDRKKNQEMFESMKISPEKISLLNLSTSKYDSNHPSRLSGSILKSFPSMNSIDDSTLQPSLSQMRIDEMSKPLDRNKYKGPEDTKISTNHLGRQRPAPTEEAIVAAITPRQSISINEFKQWLDHNKAWKETSQKKVEITKNVVAMKFASSSTPQITSKSQRLAESANMKESIRLRELEAELIASHEIPQEESEEVTLIREYNERMYTSKGRYRSPRRSSSPPHTPIRESKYSEDKNIDSSPLLDVYERLALRGKIAAEKNRTRTPPPINASFSPSINSRSELLAIKHRLKASPPSLNIAPRRSKSPNATNRSSISSFISQPKPRPFPINQDHDQDQYSQLDEIDNVSLGARSNAESINSSRSQKPVNLKEKVTKDIEKYRARSVSRSERIEKEYAKKEYRRSSTPTTVKPFHPTIIANETNRIMDKKKSSFAERNIRSVEKMLIRKVMASRSLSPGPGHYHGLKVSGLGNVSPPPKSSKPVESRCQSPGYRGYSFGKGPLLSSILQDNLTSTFEIKSNAKMMML